MTQLLSRPAISLCVSPHRGPPPGPHLDGHRLAPPPRTWPSRARRSGQHWGVRRAPRLGKAATAPIEATSTRAHLDDRHDGPRRRTRRLAWRMGASVVASAALLAASLGTGPLWAADGNGQVAPRATAAPTADAPGKAVPNADPDQRALSDAHPATDTQTHPATDTPTDAVADPRRYQGCGRQPLERLPRLRAAGGTGHGLRLLQGHPGHVARGRHLPAPHPGGARRGPPRWRLPLLRLSQARQIAGQALPGHAARHHGAGSPAAARGGRGDVELAGPAGPRGGALPPARPARRAVPPDRPLPHDLHEPVHVAPGRWRAARVRPVPALGGLLEVRRHPPAPRLDAVALLAGRPVPLQGRPAAGRQRLQLERPTAAR